VKYVWRIVVSDSGARATWDEVKGVVGEYGIRKLKENDRAERETWSVLGALLMEPVNGKKC
jgi:hypothetical protein